MVKVTLYHGYMILKTHNAFILLVEMKLNLAATRARREHVKSLTNV